MKEMIWILIKDEEGQGLAEYGLIISLVVVFLISSLLIFRNQLSDIYNENILEKLP